MNKKKVAISGGIFLNVYACIAGDRSVVFLSQYYTTRDPYIRITWSSFLEKKAGLSVREPTWFTRFKNPHLHGNAGFNNRKTIKKSGPFRPLFLLFPSKFLIRLISPPGVLFSSLEKLLSLLRELFFKSCISNFSGKKFLEFRPIRLF